jgi:hypothetical protein
MLRVCWEYTERPSTGRWRSTNCNNQGGYNMDIEESHNKATLKDLRACH